MVVKKDMVLGSLFAALFWGGCFYVALYESIVTGVLLALLFIFFTVNTYTIQQLSKSLDSLRIILVNIVSLAQRFSSQPEKKSESDGLKEMLN